jgi:thioredoxin reductase (NADPH)
MRWISTPDAIWLASLILAAAIFLLYFLTFRRRERRDRARALEARELGIHRPTAQYPYIDPAICIGCGACVRACPEKDVLGLVGGLAVVVNGVRCIGIGQCEKACPVQAIQISVGDFRGRSDVPRTDEHNQTDVPGLYIAGELGGLALIRNAIEQGRETVAQIANALRERDGSPDPELLDLIIVGAGPAGLSAALSATERGLSYVVLEQQRDLGGTIFNYPRRKLTHTQPVEIPLYGQLKRAEYSKEELLEIFQTLVERHGLNLHFSQRVVDVARNDGGFEVSSRQAGFRSRTVLLAIGRRGTPRKLGVDGEQLQKVAYQVRDAAEYTDTRILVVGGGDSAVEAALGLAAQRGNEVSISYRKDRFFRIKAKNKERLDKALSRGQVKTIMSSEVREIRENAVRLRTPEGEIEVANDAVIVLIGGEPPFPFLRRAGVRFWDEVDDEEGWRASREWRDRQPPVTG